jgi:hypothetical protein
MEYVNDFLFFVIRPYKAKGEDSLLYCSGVNVTRFLPLTKGRHGQGSNPVVRGLQLVRTGIFDMALKNGARAKKISGNECAGITPTMDTWYTEGIIIENAPERFADEAIRYSVIDLLVKISNALRLDEEMPEYLLSPEDLQEFIEGLCRKYGRSEGS